MKKEHVKDSEDKKERKLGREQGEEPLTGVHLGRQSNFLQYAHIYNPVLRSCTDAQLRFRLRPIFVPVKWFIFEHF
jgi:hypothetical protein